MKSTHHFPPLSFVCDCVYVCLHVCYMIRDWEMTERPAARFPLWHQPGENPRIGVVTSGSLGSPMPSKYQSSFSSLRTQISYLLNKFPFTMTIYNSHMCMFLKILLLSSSLWLLCRRTDQVTVKSVNQGRYNFWAATYPWRGLCHLSLWPQDLVF